MNSTLKLVIHIVKNNWALQLMLLILILINSGTSLLSPYVTKIIIDKVFPQKNMELLMQLICFLFFCYIIRIGTNHFADIIHTRLGSAISSRLRSSVFMHTIRQPLFFFHSNNTGALVYKLNSQIEYIESFLTGNLVKFLNNVVTLVGISVLLAVLNLKLFLFSIVLIPFLLVVILKFREKVRTLFRNATKKSEELNHYFFERIEHVRLIKLYNTYEYEGHSLAGSLQDLSLSWLEAIKFSSLKRNISTFIIAIPPLIVFAVGGKDIITGAMSIGSLVAFLQYLNRLFSPVSEIVDLNTELSKFKVALQGINEVLESEIETDVENVSGISYHEQINTIEFSKVSFSYQNHPKIILDEVDLILQYGKSYALVGESGCGKSTLINLLCKLYAPTLGSIKLNGMSIRDMARSMISQKISVVTQDSLIFYDTLFENIKYGSPNASQDDVMRACEEVGLSTSIENNHLKLNSLIGSNGTNLSGGQKQRIAIARIMLRSPDVIIMDEATSALDSASEQFIIQSIKKKFGKRCILIVISHRFSTVKEIDNIILISKGKVASSGQLKNLANNPQVIELFQNQLAS